jgi:hypothetical protein
MAMMVALRYTHSTGAGVLIANRLVRGLRPRLDEKHTTAWHGFEEVFHGTSRSLGAHPLEILTRKRLASAHTDAIGAMRQPRLTLVRVRG